MMKKSNTCNEIVSPSNKFILLFGFESCLMFKLFDYFLEKEQDSNECSNVLNLILSCDKMYASCNVFISRRILLWSRTKNFDTNKLNLVHRLSYDSNKMIKNKLTHFSNLKKLIFTGTFNQPLKKNILPSNLTELTFGKNFNQPLKEGIMPSNLTGLTFGYYYNQPLIKGFLASKLTQLVFCYKFNQPIDPGVIPSNLTILTFGGCFDQPLVPGVIPSSLTELTFGTYFDQPLK